MEFVYINAKELIELHDRLIDIGIQNGKGGIKGFVGGRDISDLESIIYFLKSDYYKTLEEKLTYLFYAINKNHIFLDGNKRSSIYFSARFLAKNTDNQTLVEKYTRELEDIAVKVANNNISKEELHKIICDLLKS